MLWLQQGNFSQGWDEFEWRRGVPHRMRAREIAAPEWDGSSLAGKTLLVHGEGNLDEEILFASCLGDVIQSSGKCRIACDPRLVPLFEQSFPMANIEPLDPKPASTWRPQAIRDESRLQIPRRKGQRAELVSVDESNRSELQDGIDFHVPLGSLPRHTRRTAESFPQAAGFLHARPNRLQFWREKLATLGDGPRIGLAWRSTAPAAPASSYPAWDHWSALVAAPGVQFVSLHGGDFRSDVELAASVWGAQIHVPVACSSLDDLAETAALISSLDLVIAVDNVFAHLAGALGAACWTVLPPAWGWVWGLGDRTPWYGSMRLFRAPRASAWPSLFEQLAAALAQFTQERRQVAMSIDVRSDAPHDGARRRKRDALTITSTQD
jgi:hypothetical protein